MVYKTTDVSIVIPNWNGKDLLEKNLPSVIKAAGKAEIIVVDDGSTDDSVAFLSQHYPHIRIIEKAKNEGFAGTVDVGVLKAKGDIVVLLNTDIEPQPTFLQSLLFRFEDPYVFAVGCLDKSEEQKNIALRGRGIASWKKGFFIHARGDIEKQDTAWVSGGSGAFRKSMWVRLGGMDRLYNPFYWEDIDLSYRARKAGYKVLFESKSIAIHRHEEGKIKSSFTADQIKSIAYRNQFIFIWKNLSDPGIFFTHLCWLPIRLVQACFQGDFRMLDGFLHAFYLLPTIIHHRFVQSKLWKVNDKNLEIKS